MRGLEKSGGPKPPLHLNGAKAGPELPPLGPRPNPSPPGVVAWAFSANPRPNPRPIPHSLISNVDYIRLSLSVNFI
ncbi:hypothetical protein HanLR1_Chr05g0181511 [Helianthus annuus]|nr:hypothetical protein HanHA89_Chr05g0192031 [Helianthus annuus]KAJ0750393.1 hypothetical protein HanLR1_Chr05g0181511 [Helianthus annuus]